jgi:hypothetical protein
MIVLIEVGELKVFFIFIFIGGSSYVGQRLAGDETQDALTSPCSTHSDLIGSCLISNQDLLSMTIGGQDQQPDESRGLTGLTMMVGQTRLNVEPAPIDCGDEVKRNILNQSFN